LTARVATTGKPAPGVVLPIVHNRQFPDLARAFMVTAGDPDGFNRTIVHTQGSAAQQRP